MASVWCRVFPPEPNRDPAPFTEEPGLEHMPTRTASPLEYFNLFFTFNILGEIVRQTNRYASYYMTTHTRRLGQHARARLWTKLSISELKKFLAIVFNMGLIKKASMAEYWSKNTSQETSWFRRIMSRNRFQNILKFLHVTDYRRVANRENPGYDPAARFKPLVDYINTRFPFFIRPNRQLCIDETLVGCKGKSAMTQYIPSKKAKFGIKFWVLTEAISGYIMQMHIYRGKEFESNTPGQLQGTNVVLKLIQSCNLFNKGYHVVCDNFFCSIDLCKKLLEKGTLLTGTLRKNRPMPLCVRNVNLGPGESFYIRRGPILCMAYRGLTANKPVRLLSSLLPAKNGTTKPKIVSHYNAYMGSVDHSDAMTSAYDGKRKCIKVWKKMFLHIFHRMLLNAFVIYLKNTSDLKPMSRLRFIQTLIHELVQYRPPTRRQGRGRQQVTIVKIGSGKEKDCIVCSRRYKGGPRRRSRTMCTRCEKGLHQHCLPRHNCVMF